MIFSEGGPCSRGRYPVSPRKVRGRNDPATAGRRGGNSDRKLSTSSPDYLEPRTGHVFPPNLNVSFQNVTGPPRLPLTATGEHFEVQRMRAARRAKVSERGLNLEVLRVVMGWEFISKHEMYMVR